MMLLRTDRSGKNATELRQAKRHGKAVALCGRLDQTRFDRGHLMSTSSAPLKRSKRPFVAQILIWGLFVGGLVLQFFSPHLEIAHDSFVIPSNVNRPGMAIDPRALVKRERWIQVCSAVLVLAGTTGLALYYRRTLVRSFVGKRGE